jgi:ComF family protein
MRTIGDKVKHILLDALFPNLCIPCGKKLSGGTGMGGICEACAETISINTALTCPVCGNRMAENKKTCHRNAPYRLAAAARYDDEKIQKLIWALKYKRTRVAAAPLAEFLVRHIGALHIDLAAYTIIPVPLHPSRVRERGFNQAEEIAKIFGEKMKLVVMPALLERTKRTIPQAETKTIEERRENMARSFAVRRPELVNGKNIILVDDVFTSGATIGEAVSALRSAGAKKIIAAVVARA